jgi:hypothetical protein
VFGIAKQGKGGKYGFEKTVYLFFAIFFLAVLTWMNKAWASPFSGGSVSLNDLENAISFNLSGFIKDSHQRGF